MSMHRASFGAVLALLTASGCVMQVPAAPTQPIVQANAASGTATAAPLLTGRVLAPPGVVARIIGNDGASIVAQGGGNIIGNDGASIIGNDGASLRARRLLADAPGLPLAGARVFLTDAAGVPIPGVAPARTDGQGRFVLAGAGALVRVEVQTAAGKPAWLERPLGTDPGPDLQVDLASTVVTAGLRARGGLASPPSAAEIQRAVEAVAAHLPPAAAVALDDAPALVAIAAAVPA
ncbi:MAG: hypothetical protein JWM80_6230, partial [Cyanobacteria bacterium RYN_339]|nr:hypothetical protein [Cyanobacteria bacterium RYN_339]